MDDRYMLPAQDILERKANDKSKEVLSVADEKWVEYDKGMKKILDAYEKFIMASELQPEHIMQKTE